VTALNRERHRQIDRVFQAALARDPTSRADFLDEACAGDPELRREVESLLSSDEQAGNFIECPALEIAPELLAGDATNTVTGKILGPYRIDRHIGSGGMGKVYLAYDMRLGRRVALKLLDPTLISDSEVRARFLREARLASALDHTNICAVHEVGEAGGRLFIAMQYVEGATLRQIIKGHALELDALLSISLQVADAVAEAHEHGIIHRDIKPGNVIVTPKGQAKVLDFGLAKLLESSESEDDTHLTITGAVMGTPAAMSPEQARGERVDHRSDIFSFGVVMYEMATGRLPFKGKTRAEVIGALLKEMQTPAVEIDRKIPTRLSEIIDRALTKEPADRYQSMTEMIADLRQVVLETGGLDHLFHSSGGRLGMIKPYAHLRRHNLFARKSVLTTAAFGIILIILGLTAASFWLKPSTPRSTPQQSLISTFPGSHRAASFSPDGKKIAFVNADAAVPQVWVKDLTQGEPVQITFGEDPADRPRWSPLGDQIVYARRSKGSESIWSVLASGGTPRKVIEGGRNPNWSWDGARLVFERGYDIWTARVDGSDQRKVEGVPPTDLLLTDRMPAFSPNSSFIAFFQKSKGPMGDYWILPSTGGQARRLTSDDVLGGAPTWTPDGQFIIFPSRRAGSLTLWKVPVSGGEPQPILVSTGEDTDPEISRDGGRLLYTNTRNSFVVTITDPTSGEQRELYQSRSDLVDPSFSPRGDRVLFFGFAEGGGVQLYTVNADGSKLTQLTHGKAEQNIHPHWSADGTAVYFYQQRPTTSFRKLSLSDGLISELAAGWEWATQNHARVDFEGRLIIYTRLDRGGPAATMIRDLATGTETAFTALLRQARWSHDGKLIVGSSVAGQQWANAEIMVCPADGGPCRALTRGHSPHWSIDDSRIYFYRRSNLRDGEELWSITREGADERHVAHLRPMHPIGPFFDISPSGQIVWIQYRRGRHELWLSDYPSR
jgi:serine/threonine protein kinase